MHCDDSVIVKGFSSIITYFYTWGIRIFKFYSLSNLQLCNKVPSTISWSVLLLIVSDFLQPHGLHQASLSFTIYRILPMLMSIELVMPSNNLILCHPLSSFLQSFPASGSFLMSQLFTSGSQSWSFSFSTSPSNEYAELISFNWLVWSRDSQESSQKPQFKRINYPARSFLYGLNLTSMHNY